MTAKEDVVIWKDIEGFEGLYQVSNLGTIKGLKRVSGGKLKKLVKEKYMAICFNKKGYRVVCLNKEGKCITKKVSRLVANAFIPNNQNKPQVNHIDGNKSNDHESNLEWVTASENILHAYRIGLSKPSELQKESARRTVKMHRCKKVNLISLHGEIINKEFESVSEAGRQLNIPYQSISRVCTGQRKQTYGMKFEFIKDNQSFQTVWVKGE